MRLETLKELIEVEFDRCETISQFKSEVFRLLEMYDRDMVNKVVLPIPPFDKIPLTSPPPPDIVIKECQTPTEPNTLNSNWASK